MATTLLLDRTAWDLVTDARGNIAMASEPYSQTQDAASAVRVFQGEAYYDGTLGLPYFDQILGRVQPVQIFKQGAIEAALTVPGVTSAEVFLTSFNHRTLAGQLQIKTANGVLGVAL
jgi:hypothetical protein